MNWHATFTSKWLSTVTDTGKTDLDVEVDIDGMLCSDDFLIM